MANEDTNNKRYWTFKHQPGQNKSEAECKKFVEKALKFNAAIMQYEYNFQDQGKVTSNWRFIKDNLKEGDILFLRGGEKIYAVGEIIKPRHPADVTLNMQQIINNRSHGEYYSGNYDGVIDFEDCSVFYEDLAEGENGWGQSVDVQAWKYYYPDGIYCKDQSNYVDGSNEFNVIKQLKKDAALSFLQQLEERFMDKELGLLKANKNLILTGAPGTGKTFLARKMAIKLIFDKEEENLSNEEKELWKKHYSFVQFHPSYDYTDFVEGLRPKAPENDDENIGFELKDGVFKNFCKEAIKASVVNGIDNFEEAWTKLVNKFDATENGQIDFPLLSGERTFPRELNDDGDGLRIPGGGQGFINKQQLYRVYRGLKGVAGGGHDNYRRAIINFMKHNCELQEYKLGTQLSSDNVDNFVFVIDEINRGEISKIFGELFFSIDPGYRGEKGKVKTQYANMANDDDVFKNGFYVPENVYIIGTMNDIDRSVESMDFAMRRRFVFQEVTAEESAKNMGLPDATNKRMKPLNDEISRIQGLNSSYHIGGAYFLTKDKDGNTVEPDYDELWTLRLKPLLKEYLRGMPDADDKLKNLKAAYYLSAT